MKTILTIFFVIFLSTSIYAEQDLILGDTTHGGFGALVFRGTKIKNKNAMLLGFRGGWIINNTFVLGANVMFLPKFNGITKNPPNQQEDLNLTYGGLWVDFIIFSDSAIHFSAGSTFGVGKASFVNPNYYDTYYYTSHTTESDNFYVIEPEVNVMFNLVSWFRIGVGASYRITRGVELSELTNNDLNGFSAHVLFKFGKFW